MPYLTTLTTAGKQLLATALTGACVIDISRVAIGSGDATGHDLSSLTNLVTPQANVPIKDNRREGECEVLEVVLTNESVSVAFNMTEIGIFAKDPNDSTQEILYQYIQITEGDGGKIPAHASTEMRRVLMIYCYVTDSAETVVRLDSSLVYVTQDEFTNHLNDESAHHELFAKKQDRTDLLSTSATIVDASYIPFYDGQHKKIRFVEFLKRIVNTIFPSASGILKGDGSGTVEAATGGSDYQEATQNLTNIGDDIADDDFLPVWDDSENAHRKVAWGSIISKLRSLFFTSVNGIMKSNGSGLISAAVIGTDYQAPTNTLSNLTSLANADKIPVYDVSDNAHRSFTLATLISTLQSGYDQTPVKGSVKAVTSNGVYEALNQKIGSVFLASKTPPVDTRILWIDTTPVNGGLKYHNGSTWVRVPLAYSDVT